MGPTNMLRSVVDDPALVYTVVRYPDGRFAIPNVPPGDYYLTASISPGPGTLSESGSVAPRGSGTVSAELAFVPVTVNGNEVHVNVRTNAGASLSGRVVIEGSPAAGKPVGPIIVSTRQPASSTVPSVHAATTVADDRTFRLVRLGGSFLVTAQADDLALKSLLIGGREVTGRAIELKGTEQVTDAVIVMTSDTARLQGTATNDAGEPFAATVILFADSPDRFGPQSPGVHVTRAIGVTPASEAHRAASAPEIGRKLPAPGAFTFPRVLPGRYALIAVDSGISIPALDRDTFTRWRSLATEVTLTAGQTTTAALKVVQ